MIELQGLDEQVVDNMVVLIENVSISKKNYSFDGVLCYRETIHTWQYELGVVPYGFSQTHT